MGGEQALAAMGTDPWIRAVVAEGATGQQLADRGWRPHDITGILQRGRITPHAGHTLGLATAPRAWEAHVISFLNVVLRPSPTSSRHGAFQPLSPPPRDMRCDVAESVRSNPVTGPAQPEHRRPDPHASVRMGGTRVHCRPRGPGHPRGGRSHQRRPNQEPGMRMT